MYTYKGMGYLLPISDIADSVEEFINEYATIITDDITDEASLENNLCCGDFESSDNIEHAALNDEEIDTSLGIIICFDYDGNNYVDEFLSILKAADVSPYDYYGNIVVECLQ